MKKGVTVNLCSFDAHSKGQPWPPPLKERYEESEGLNARIEDCDHQSMGEGGRLVVVAQEA